MNTLKDTLSTLNKPSRLLAEFVMKKSRESFDEFGSVSPGMFAIPDHGFNVKCEDVEVMDDDTKPIVWAKLRRWRSQYPVVGWVSEVWGTRSMDDKNRTEAVIFNVWQGSRMVSFIAKITRNPSKMGPWEIMHDSYFPKSGKSVNLEGAAVDGPRYSGDYN